MQQTKAWATGEFWVWPKKKKKLNEQALDREAEKTGYTGYNMYWLFNPRVRTKRRLQRRKMIGQVSEAIHQQLLCVHGVR